MFTWLLVLALQTFGDDSLARPRYTEAEILQAVAGRMNISLQESIPTPLIVFGSTVPLQQFQDDVEPQWGFRPEVILNVYLADLNKIYILDQAKYYVSVNRYIDDSIAHELVHYLQVKYKGISLHQAGDEIELEAIRIQTWFRENYF